MTGFYSTPTAMSSLDETWSTPRATYADLHAEFGFTLDAAALQVSALCEQWYGPDHPDPTRRDAFDHAWHLESQMVWLNPPYGRTIGQWMAKANSEAAAGATVVCLVPSRTDTRWWHDSCLNHEIRFVKGRLTFGRAANPAPFPSAIVIMRGLT